MDASVLEGKLSFKVLQLTFSSMLDWGSHIIFIGKTASTRSSDLFYEFLSPEIALYLYKSTIRSCM